MICISSFGETSNSSLNLTCLFIECQVTIGYDGM